MGNSKVIFGNETLIDLTGDTVTPDTLLAGTTAHNRSGEQIVGTTTVPEELDDLTDVAITSPADGDLLQYDSASDEWVNSNAVPQELAAMQEAGAVNHFVLTATSNVNNGITYTVDADAGSVAMNGEASDTSTLVLTSLANCEHLAGKTVTVDLQNSIPSASVGFVRFVARAADKTTVVYSSEQIISKSTFLLPSTAVYYLANLYIASGQTVSNLTIKPMLYDARLVNPTYQPFTMTNRELTDAVNPYAQTAALQTIVKENATGVNFNGTNGVHYGYVKVGKIVFAVFSVFLESSYYVQDPAKIGSGFPKPVVGTRSVLTKADKNESGFGLMVALIKTNGECTVQEACPPGTTGASTDHHGYYYGSMTYITND